MRKKEKWMFIGAIVLADGQKATITKMEENTIDKVDYVYYIYCKIEGKKIAGPYHPNEVQELVVVSGTKNIGMQILEILKPITEEGISKFISHSDDIADVMEAAESETLDYLRHDLVVMLINNGFVR